MMACRPNTPSGLPAISPTRGEKTRGAGLPKLCCGGCGWVKPSPLWGGWGGVFLTSRQSGSHSGITGRPEGDFARART
ncbi:hypothetical protein NCHU2750_06860 [Neorhizobium sp. NCHU2750]|nr:hypothetical protein NCHU2750_06860 [Neorhizobium sp. NCHU2750]